LSRENKPAIDTISLSVSCVTFRSNQLILSDTIESLLNSCEQAKRSGSLNYVEVFLIDNGPNVENLSILQFVQQKYKGRFDFIHIITGHGNIGYGKGNNLAINKTDCSYHLIINPDIIVDKENISLAVRYLEINDDVGMLAPHALDQYGHTHYIAKRYPGFLVLLTRALKLKFMQKLFRDRLYDYEYRDKIPAQHPLEIELASGCYMFCRTDILKKLGGFDPRFFMYFEDFDLSMRLRQSKKIMHLHELQVIHLGGGASAKGWLHIHYFCTSLFQFFGRYHFKF